MKLITFVFILALSSLHSLICMVSDKNIFDLPVEITSSIVAYPNFQAIHDIIQMQIQSPRPLIEIQQALFPCRSLIMTCRTYSAETFLKQVMKNSKDHLSKIIPQGIGLFFLPKSVQFKIYDDNQEYLKTLENLCLFNDDFTNNMLSVTIASDIFFIKVKDNGLSKATVY